MHPDAEGGLEVIENDAFLKKFLKADETNNQEQEESEVLSVAEQLSKLSLGISIIDKEIQKQVLENHEDLLSQATWIDKMESVLEMMSVHVHSLLSGVEHVRARIADHYHKMVKINLVMKNILQTLDILRRISRIQDAWNRMSSHIINDAHNYLKISQNVRELGQHLQLLFPEDINAKKFQNFRIFCLILDELINEVDLSGIDLIEPNIQKLRIVKKDIGEKARQMLVVAMKNGDVPEISKAVQILFNLGLLVTVTKDILKNAFKHSQEAIAESLDVRRLTEKESAESSKRGPGKAAIPSLINASTFRQKMWSALEKIFDGIFFQAIQIETFEAVLNQNRNDFVGTKSNTYIQTFPEDCKNITRDFWNFISSFLAGELVNSASSCSLLKSALEGEYPRFLRLYMDLCKRLQTAEKTEHFSYDFPMNETVTAPFKKAYLSRLDSMVLDPVHSMFTRDEVPTVEDIDLLIRIIQSELCVALFDPNLSSEIAENITKSIRLFCNNCDEKFVVQGPDAIQVIGPRNSVQNRNIEIANVLEYLKTQLKSVTSNLGNNTHAAVKVNLSLVRDVDTLIIKIVTPVLNSVVDAVKKILLTMHKEDFSRKEKKDISLYMKELQDFIPRAYEAYLKPIQSEEILKKYCSESGKYCVEFFIRHVALVRPLSQEGRTRLVADCNQFEATISPLLGEEPKSYRTLRLFRLMLLQSPEEILNNSSFGENLPYSVALFYLFSYAPTEMESPHQGLHWSEETMSEYLDKHSSEREKIELISGALERYCKIVRDESGKSYHTIYGVMTELILKSGCGVK